ncbi:NAK protein kinase Ppk38 [Schizosaccharomyces octosporus yFS286]|uniref:NAK protein kinase Ppk38 n=1 Tax=Schizosaccharomyces octosporus (strain yFS286) TaxID=483514 RepID=S9PUS8_SCHOY|nr:NAK protein kinase Ppk38 [Schizosaccharomyces octosporus yFS286]EPX71747.1 NAK protein kinase Ppk38 [Schizosaccharomyces octosporus yFS286]
MNSSWNPSLLPKTPLPAGLLPPGYNFEVEKFNVTVVRYIAEGGFSHVYLVKVRAPGVAPYEAVLKRIFAVDALALKAVYEEVNTMKLVSNDKRCVSYYGSEFFSAGKSQFESLVLLEYCSGGGLIDFMNSRLQIRLSESEILKIASHVTEAVASMHYLRPPLIHRDLKIENVLLAAPNFYKLCDFGSACHPIPSPKTPAEIQQVEYNIEKYTTWQYRCPEMLDLRRGFGIDEKSDIWALGILFYKLCYYTTPFEQQGPLAILNVNYMFPPLPSYSSRLKRLISALLQPNPWQRPNIYQTLAEICNMQNIPVPIKDIYGGKNSSNCNPSGSEYLQMISNTQSSRLHPSQSNGAIHTNLLHTPHQGVPVGAVPMSSNLGPDPGKPPFALTKPMQHGSSAISASSRPFQPAFGKNVSSPHYNKDAQPSAAKTKTQELTKIKAANPPKSTLDIADNVFSSTSRNPTGKEQRDLDKLTSADTVTAQKSSGSASSLPVLTTPRSDSPNKVNSLISKWNNAARPQSLPNLGNRRSVPQVPRKPNYLSGNTQSSMSSPTPRASISVNHITKPEKPSKPSFESNTELRNKDAHLDSPIESDKFVESLRNEKESDPPFVSIADRMNQLLSGKEYQKTSVEGYGRYMDRSAITK